MSQQASPQKFTIAQRLEQFGPAARQRWAGYFARAGLAYPPGAVTLVGLKQERQLLVYAGARAEALALIRVIPILGASGGPGPKLREGDRQVPEGLYEIDWVNPNSRHKLSLHITYPNAFDLAHARAEGRDNPGGEIMIHGSNTSVGCLAIGDEPAADVFVLACDTGLPNLRVILSPCDLRRQPAPAAALPWVSELYAAILAELEKLPP